VLALIASILIPLAFPGICSAANETSTQEALRQLQQEFGKVLQQLSDMKRQHAVEIEALNQRILQLASARGPSQRPADDLEALRLAAQAEAQKDTTLLEEVAFKSGNIGLQALNPEISITGDLLGFYRAGDDVIHTDWFFRGLSAHFESYLDPYSRFKAAVHFGSGGAELEEAYFTRYGVLGNANVTLGKFRQQFGVVNRWHKHALDWFDHPLALLHIFGEEGVHGTGASFDWSGSIGEASQELVLQLTDGENDRIFGDNNAKNRPSILAHYKLNRELSPSTYVELGATGLIGWNDTWSTTGADINETVSSQVYGLDFTLAWEPTAQMRYRNLEWRSEFYIADKGIQAPDGSGKDRLHPWGLYSSLQTKVSRTVTLGTRFDYYRPEIKEYAALTDDLSLSPLAVTDNDAKRYQVGVMATWFQSPWVKFKLGYAYEGGTGLGEDQRIATFQAVFAAGPHKHERY
jgi:hypothetical protein